MSKDTHYEEPICVRADYGTEARIARILKRRRRLERPDLLRRALNVGLKHFELATPAELEREFAPAEDAA